MRAVVGIDPSLTSTGLCDEYGNPKTIAGKAAAGDQRLHAIGGAIYYLGEGIGSAPELAVIEDVAAQSMKGVYLGMVHGVIRYELMRASIPYALVNPMHLKLYAVGKSSGPGTDKAGLAVAAYKVAEVEFASTDECDAWWLRAMGLDYLGEPLFKMPEVNRKALAKTQWPVAP